MVAGKTRKSRQPRHINKTDSNIVTKKTKVELTRLTTHCDDVVGFHLHIMKFTTSNAEADHEGKFGHEFMEFEFASSGKLRYANNSNYKNDSSDCSSIAKLNIVCVYADYKYHV